MTAEREVATPSSERRRESWRQYNRSEKGRARNARYDASERGRARRQRYEATPRARARKLLYEQTVRAAMRAPSGVVLNGQRRDGRPKYGLSDCYRVAYASPLEYGITAPSPELVALEQRMRPDEFQARLEWAAQVRRERAAGIMSPMTLVELAQRESAA